MSVCLPAILDNSCLAKQTHCRATFAENPSNSRFWRALAPFFYAHPPKMVRQHSQVWSYFSIADNSRSKQKCNLCGRVISITGASTGNLNRHLSAKHPSIVLELNKTRNRLRLQIKNEQKTPTKKAEAFASAKRGGEDDEEVDGDDEDDVGTGDVQRLSSPTKLLEHFEADDDQQQAISTDHIEEVRI